MDSDYLNQIIIALQFTFYITTLIGIVLGISIWQYSIYLKKCKLLPPLDSIYTINDPESPFNGITGVVGHAEDGDTFFLKVQGHNITNLKPNN